MENFFKNHLLIYINPINSYDVTIIIVIAENLVVGKVTAHTIMKICRSFIKPLSSLFYFELIKNKLNSFYLNQKCLSFISFDILFL